MAAGKLPDRAPERIWGGPGSGGACALCGEPVPAEQTELELEFSQNTQANGGGVHRLHARCFTLWELERRCPSRAPGEQRSGSNAAGKCHAPAAGSSHSSGSNRQFSLPEESRPGTIAGREHNPDDAPERE